MISTTIPDLNSPPSVLSIKDRSNLRDLVKNTRGSVATTCARALLEMEMDSHGGLEVTIRQTESKKKLPNNFVKQTPECS